MRSNTINTRTAIYVLRQSGAGADFNFQHVRRGAGFDMQSAPHKEESPPLVSGRQKLYDAFIDMLEKFMTISIRLLSDNDHAAVAVAVLMEEMQAHYSVPCPSRETILAGLQSRPPGTELLIAEDGDSVLGFAAFSAIYPGPWLQPGIFLKDLFVSKRHRQ
ncbi:MAG: hypothetical protein NVSMB28_09290 [Collimonas sp.]